MSDQNQTLMAAYGATAFYMHVTEDILRLHLCDCDYYRINAYQLPLKPALHKLRLQRLIDEFAKIHPDSPEFIRGLHCIREARNDVVHEFITQVGSDVASEEGRDQILALLLRLVRYQCLYISRLRLIHEAHLRDLPILHLDRLLQRKEPEFVAHVSTSDAQTWLDELVTISDATVA